jgi:hypothetical protein
MVTMSFSHSTQAGPDILLIPPRSQAMNTISHSQAWQRLHAVRPGETLNTISHAAIREHVRGACENQVAAAHAAFDDRHNSQTPAPVRVSDVNRAHGHPLPKPASLIFDEPMNLKSGLRYDFTGISISVSASVPFLFEADGLENVEISGCTVVADKKLSFLRINGSRKVMVRDCDVTATCFGIVLRTGNEAIHIADNRFSQTTRAGVFAQGENRNVLICGNTFHGTNHASNFAAGIVLASIVVRNPANIMADYYADGHWALASTQLERLKCPQMFVVENNKIINSLSSGIYCDGAIGCVIAGNEIVECDKEGMCLDGGSSLNLVEANIFKRNGRRIRQSDWDLANDFVLHQGRDAAGASNAKLPGLSLDSAIMNCVRSNTFDDNWGGGIKMVRAGFLNWVDDNRIALTGDATRHDTPFAGILLDNHPPDCNSVDLDFAACHGNWLTRNFVTSYEPGIRLADNCGHNTITNNSVTASCCAIDARQAPHTVLSENDLHGKLRKYQVLISPARKLLRPLRQRFMALVNGRYKKGWSSGNSL